MATSKISEQQTELLEAQARFSYLKAGRSKQLRAAVSATLNFKTGKPIQENFVSSGHFKFPNKI